MFFYNDNRFRHRERRTQEGDGVESAKGIGDASNGDGNQDGFPEHPSRDHLSNEGGQVILDIE